MLGVDLIVIVVLLVFVLSRKRWVMKQPGAFRGAIRVAGGEIDGLPAKWRRGYGHWIRDILVWTKGPFLFQERARSRRRTGGQRPARTDEAKRLGDHPGVIRVTAGEATVEVAAQAEDIELLLGPYRKPDVTTAGRGAI